MGDPIGQAIARGYDPDRSGDIVVALRPYWFLSASAASHGSSYGYDTHVPILMMGPGIAPGEYLAPASPLDIAPTLGFVVGVTLPHSQGRVLTERCPALARARSRERLDDGVLI
jgi:predicted AlkP superfamily pyrophosphatase or phosphodiesterase